MAPLRVYSQIEINASPQAVRDVFINFPAYCDWYSNWKIDANDTETIAASIKAGTCLRVSMQGMNFHPTGVENTTERFTWDGSLWGAIVGRHSFIFSPSNNTPGGTTFIQSEDFTGPLTIFFRPWAHKFGSSPNFESFNEALKLEVERSQSNKHAAHS